jgi:phosphoenolpyruvate synthase/pyruvate phosphate dikinase
MGYVLWLDECVPGCDDLVGGKALGLGSLLREGLQVPPGFAVTTDAYRECVLSSGLAREIERTLGGAETPKKQQAASERIRDLFERASLAKSVAAKVAWAYQRLSHGDPAPVAVRSSATSEDSKAASFAGQHETYLWIRGREAVVRHVVHCWASLFTPEAISYRLDRGVPLEHLAMGVVIQRMVDAEAAGVITTIDPVTGDPSQISIESSFGLGVAVVGGDVTPDRFCVDKVTMGIRGWEITPKRIAYRFDPDVSEVRAFEVPPSKQIEPSLTRDEVLAAASLGKRVEKLLGSAQDIEWAVGPGPASSREVILLQTRPETVWSQRPSAPFSRPRQSILERMVASMRTPVKLRDPGVSSDRVEVPPMQESSM